MLNFIIPLIIIVTMSTSLAQTIDSSLSDTNNPSFGHDFLVSTKEAILSPITLGTLALTAGIYFSKSDSRITNWALTNHPIYGSKKNAQNISNILQYSSLAIFSLAYLIKNYPSESYGFDRSSFSELGFDASAAAAVILAMECSKYEFRRTRPDGSDNKSFPSGHTSFVSINCTLASNDITEMNLSKPTSIILKSCLGLMVAATAWGRIEGDKHYATDALVGAALGHFVGGLLDNLFEDVSKRKPELYLGLNRDNYNMQLSFSF